MQVDIFTAQDCGDANSFVKKPRVVEGGFRFAVPNRVATATMINAEFGESARARRAEGWVRIKMKTDLTVPPKTTRYIAALAAFAASRRLHVIATIFITFVVITGGLGALACIIVLAGVTGAHSTVAMAIAGAALFGCAFWTVSGLLIGITAQTYARDVQARAPWEPK